MHKRAAQTALVGLLFLAASTASAETTAGKASLTPFAGGYTFDGAQSLKTEPVYGLRLGYGLSDRWDVEALFDYVSTKPKSGSGDANAYNYRIEGLYNFFTESSLVPFLAIGAGANTVDYPDSTGEDTKTRFALAYGGGLKYFFSESWALRADLRHLLVAERSNRVLGNLEYALGLSYFFGQKTAPAPAPQDSDGDGVYDDMDKCPGTPRGVTVNSDGCPLDTDGDGVLDYMDKCPDTPRGVTVDSKGCPLDTDGDGVLDYMDKCPDTPKGVTVNSDGCPLDTDGDGVLDYLDKCPDTPKGVTVDSDGCPLDTDGDGVLDYMDKCPGTPMGVKVDSVGCPIPVIEKKSMTLNIEFDTAKSDIRPEYNDEIKRVADLMAAYPDINIRIEGHTDNVGSKSYNEKLSTRRAESVKKYLVEKFGIAPERLSFAGYGPSRPVASNATAEGRQKNRRIEAVINYTVTK